MSDIHELGDIINGYATIKPTDGYPSGQTIFYAGEGRTLDNTSWSGPIISESFDYAKIDISKTGAFTDGSDTIAASGTSQEVFAANAERNYLYFLNASNANMYVDFGENATASSSFLVSPSGNLTFDSNFVPNGAVNVICSTSGAAFVAKEA